MYQLISYVNPRGVREYQNSVLRIEDQAIIPFDEANSDYQKYLQWLVDGNTPDDPANIE